MAGVIPPSRLVLPPTAAAISGHTYKGTANPIGLKSFSVSFPGGAEAMVRFELHDQTDGPRPVGLDNVPRVSPNGRFGLPVTVRGAWESSTTFTIDYDEAGNINAYRFRQSFSGRKVDAVVAERTGLVNARFTGTKSD